MLYIATAKPRDYAFIASHQALPLARKFQFVKRKGESLVHFDHVLDVVSN